MLLFQGPSGQHTPLIPTQSLDGALNRQHPCADAPGNKISNDDVAELLSILALPESPKIHELDLSCNSALTWRATLPIAMAMGATLGEHGPTPAGYSGRPIGKVTALHRLGLGGLNLGERGALQLAAGLRVNNTVQVCRRCCCEGGKQHQCRCASAAVESLLGPASSSATDTKRHVEAFVEVRLDNMLQVCKHDGEGGGESLWLCLCVGLGVKWVTRTTLYANVCKQGRSGQSAFEAR